VWGKQDDVTPPFVAEKFHELLPDSRLQWVDKCGHAPMMEHPDEFNALLREFLEEIA
jgi:pimeloyl-ACP methyl ester carboxylesterase